MFYEFFQKLSFFIELDSNVLLKLNIVSFSSFFMYAGTLKDRASK